MQEKRQTLGKNILPIKYTVEFEPDLKTFKFKGSEKIEIAIDSPTDTILLNSAELVFKSAVIEKDGKVEKARVHLIKEKEQVALKIKNKIGGKARVLLNFSGMNNDKMYGFYRSKYIADGKECYLLSSQFEPADARKAFPCFDEPEFKASFEVSMLVDRSLECISNMPIKRSENLKSGKKRVNFLPTPVMSTYLLYLGVGDYDCVEGSLGRVKLRVLTIKGKKKFAALSMEYLKKFLNFYNTYFGIKFPLPKLDLLAIPDFSAGAMENWGAITFREVALLGDENTAVASRQQIAETVAHELAHMWFGDLVTMAWWDDLWLNESFATYMSFKAMETVMPEWNMGIHYVEDVVYSALVTDQLKATHPIAAKVSSPAEISAQFDSGISYDKGGSVLLMLEDYVGPELFKIGLHKYLKEHSYGNATEHDLWRAIDSTAKKNKKFVSAEKVASYWINTPGYPIVSVDIKGGAYSLLQHRFLISDDEQKASEWPIPIHYLKSDGDESQFLMSKSIKRISAGSSSGWIKLNYKQKGFYRVRYSGELLARLGEAIRKGDVEDLDAWGIENDLFISARSGRISFGVYLEFIQKYCFNRGYLINSALQGHLGWLSNMLYGTSPYEEVKAVLVLHSRGILNKIGLKRKKGEKSTDTILRSSAISNLGLAQDEDIVKMANNMFLQFVKNGTRIDDNLKSSILKIVAWTGNAGTFKTLISLYKKETNTLDKVRYLAALGLFKDKTLCSKALAFALSKEVKYQDTFYVSGYAASNPATRKLYLNWVLKHWKTLLNRYPIGVHIISDFVSDLGAQNSVSARQEVAAFFGDKSNLRGDVVSEFGKALERIDANIRFMKANSVSAE